MRKIYYLSTCNTCKRIIEDLELKDRNFSFQDIKYQNVSSEELDRMKSQTGSYEALFNKRARKYRQDGLNKEKLTESKYKELILDEYTFLKRPVVLLDNIYYVGNSKKVVEQIKKQLNETE